MQKVHLEVDAVTLAAQDVVAAPAAPVRSQLRISDETGHRGADHGAVAGHGTLEAHLDIADALHDLDLLLRGQVTGVLVPVALTVHKERTAAGVAVSDRDDEVVS